MNQRRVGGIASGKSMTPTSCATVRPVAIAAASAGAARSIPSDRAQSLPVPSGETASTVFARSSGAALMMPLTTSCTEPSPPATSTRRRPACSARRAMCSPSWASAVSFTSSGTPASRSACSTAGQERPRDRPASGLTIASQGKCVSGNESAHGRCAVLVDELLLRPDGTLGDFGRPVEHLAELGARLPAGRTVCHPQAHRHVFLLAPLVRVRAAVGINGLLQTLELRGARRFARARLAVELLERNDALTVLERVEHLGALCGKRGRDSRGFRLRRARPGRRTRVLLCGRQVELLGAHARRRLLGRDVDDAGFVDPAVDRRGVPGLCKESKGKKQREPHWRSLTSIA